MWAGFQDKKVQRPANDFDSNLRSDLAETCVKVFFGYFYSIEKKSKIMNIWFALGKYIVVNPSDVGFGRTHPAAVLVIWCVPLEEMHFLSHPTKPIDK